MHARTHVPFPPVVPKSSAMNWWELAEALGLCHLQTPPAHICSLGPPHQLCKDILLHCCVCQPHELIGTGAKSSPYQAGCTRPWLSPGSILRPVRAPAAVNESPPCAFTLRSFCRTEVFKFSPWLFQSQGGHFGTFLLRVPRSPGLWVIQSLVTGVWGLFFAFILIPLALLSRLQHFSSLTWCYRTQQCLVLCFLFLFHWKVNTATQS